jgi:hypothetical protein
VQPRPLFSLANDVPEYPHAAYLPLAPTDFATLPKGHMNHKHLCPSRRTGSPQTLLNREARKLQRLTIFSVCVFVECSVTVQVVVRHSISFLHVFGVLYPPPPFHSVSVDLIAVGEVCTTDDDGLLVQRNVVLLVAVAELKSAGKIHRPRISKASESYAGRASGTRQKLSMLDIHVKGCASDKMLAESAKM